jgi:hypothetical protein
MAAEMYPGTTIVQEAWYDQADVDMPKTYLEMTARERAERLAVLAPFTVKADVSAYEADTYDDERREPGSSLTGKSGELALSGAMRTANVFAKGSEDFTRQLTAAVLPIDIPQPVLQYN